MTVGHLATVFVAAVSGVLVPRALGVEDYGHYSAVLALVALLQVASSLGFQRVGIRFLSPLWLTARQEFSILASTMWSIQLIAAPILGVVAFFWLRDSVGEDFSQAVLIGLGALCALGILQEATRCLFLPSGEIGKFVGFEFVRNLLRLPIVLGAFALFGLGGTFLALAALQAVLWVWTIRSLLGVVQVTPTLFSWSSLEPHISFAFWSFLDIASSRMQIQFSIVALALWSNARDAGLLAVAMQFYLLLRGLSTAVLQSVQPLMSEMEVAGERAKLKNWCDRMMGLGISAALLVASLWTLLGSTFLRLVFGTSFLPAFPVTTLLLCSMAPFAAAQVCHGMLYISNEPRAGALTSVANSAAAVIGLFVVLTQFSAGEAAIRVAWMFLVVALLFLLLTLVTLGRRTGLWLSLPRTALALLPLPAIAVVQFEAGPSLPLAIVSIALALYSSVLLGLILSAWRDREE